MKASELRINNLVYGIDEDFNRLPVKIGMGDLCDIECSTDNEGNYEPIPLTVEWLLMFGFKTANDIYYEKDGIGLITGYAVGGAFVCGNSFGSRHTHFYYVHQLQNLFFSLTGEELTIKEATK